MNVTRSHCVARVMHREGEEAYLEFDRRICVSSCGVLLDPQGSLFAIAARVLMYSIG